MILSAMYEAISHPDNLVKLTEQNAAASMSSAAYYTPLNGDAFKHALSETFHVSIWRNTLDGRVILYVPREKAYVELFDDWLTSGRTHSHAHDYLEMAYVAYGEFSQNIDGQKQAFSQGSVCVIDRNSSHYDYVGKQDNLVVFLGMSEAFFGELFLSEIDESTTQKFIRQALLTQKNLKQFIRFTPRGKDDVIMSMVETVISEYEDYRKGSLYLIKGQIIRMLDRLAMDYDLSLTGAQKHELHNLLFSEIEQYVKDNYKDASLSALVERFHFQSDYFTRLIKRYTNESFAEMKQRVCVEKAAKLLVNTDLSVSEIAIAVGYDNRRFFYNVFKRKYGMTPSQYRAQSNAAKPR